MVRPLSKHMLCEINSCSQEMVNVQHEISRCTGIFFFLFFISLFVDQCSQIFLFCALIQSPSIDGLHDLAAGDCGQR